MFSTCTHANTYTPEIVRETWNDTFPASFVASQVYRPQSETKVSFKHRRAMLFWKLTSCLSELWIGLPSLNQKMERGWEPDTRASIFTTLPTESSMDSDGLLVKFGGTLRSVSEENVHNLSPNQDIAKQTVFTTGSMDHYLLMNKKKYEIQ